MKLWKLIDSIPAIEKLINLKMDVKMAYSIRKFLLDTDSKVRAYNETRESLIRKYWEEKDWTVSVTPENMNNFFEEISSMRDEEIEVEAPEVSIDDIKGDIDVNSLILLDYLIK